MMLLGIEGRVQVDRKRVNAEWSRADPFYEDFRILREIGTIFVNGRF
jgi:hypothetical protein